MDTIAPEKVRLPEKPLFVCVLGNTETAYIEGLSAAGKTAKLTDYTPAGDAEVLETGTIIDIPILPMTPPYDTPTPALITRAALSLTGIPHIFVNAGLKVLPAKQVPLFDIGGLPGDDIRKPIAVHNVENAFKNAFALGEKLAKDHDFIVIGESIPAGTTTANAVLQSLGYDGNVSSSSSSNPLNLKKQVVEEALKSSGITCGSLRNDPLKALAYVGDPMMVAVAGLAAGLGDIPIILAGGTQMVSIFAVIKHLGYPTGNMKIVTTSYVIRDTSANFVDLARELGASYEGVDPGFGKSRSKGLQQYEVGFVKEGVGAGGAIYMTGMFGYSMEELRLKIELLCDELCKLGDLNRVVGETI
ncbi:nicotinate mononucleotide-dependent phosphoribosyltransferase CobT [Methanolobus psychrotolerans]|uniref:nicotinate mononucleotide-dependent phosphoribosyltransferase CobT n=1 Tax=Methanolobus psychrotolerans TaxID=1874706 RepID=UPI000B91A14E|nr:TIGR00303 family protein [Methanolobus psychrotolerans]